MGSSNTRALNVETYLFRFGHQLSIIWRIEGVNEKLSPVEKTLIVGLDDNWRSTDSWPKNPFMPHSRFWRCEREEVYPLRWCNDRNNDILVLKKKWSPIAQFIILNGLTSGEYFIFVTRLMYMYYGSWSWTMHSESNHIPFMLRWECSLNCMYSCVSLALTMYLTWTVCNRLPSLGDRDFKDTINFNMMRFILYWSSLLTNNNTPRHGIQPTHS